jgi:hypothetical protein
MKIESVKLTALVTWALLFTACPQEDIELPATGGGGGSGACGEWYPGDCGDAGGDCYSVEEGAVFPCAVWESARLAGEDTYLNIGDVHLEAKHGGAGPKAIVIVVSAENCPSCALLISAMGDRVGDFGDALVIGMARRNLLGDSAEEDFDLDKAETTLRAEKWPTDDWYVINDEEDYLDTSFDVNTPWVIVVGTADMVVRSASNDRYSADPDGVAKLLEEIGKLP